MYSLMGNVLQLAVLVFEPSVYAKLGAVWQLGLKMLISNIKMKTGYENLSLGHFWLEVVIASYHS
jgi:hypothetical protein